MSCRQSTKKNLISSATSSPSDTSSSLVRKRGRPSKTSSTKHLDKPVINGQDSSAERNLLKGQDNSSHTNLLIVQDSSASTNLLSNVQDCSASHYIQDFSVIHDIDHFNTPVRRTRNKIYKQPLTVPSVSSMSPVSAFISEARVATPQKTYTSSVPPFVPTTPPTPPAKSVCSPRAITLPAPFRHPKIMLVTSNVEKALKQLNLAHHCNGAYSVSWPDLLPPQAWNILKDFNITYTEGDSVNKMAALLVKSKAFTSVWGNTLTNLKNCVKFNFDIKNPRVSIGIHHYSGRNSHSSGQTFSIPSVATPCPNPLTTSISATSVTHIATSATSIQDQGGSKDSCVVCKFPVLNDDEALFCEKGCEKWYHIGCVNIPSAKYTKMGTSNRKWGCDSCAKPVKLTSAPSTSSVSKDFSSSGAAHPVSDHAVIPPGLYTASARDTCNGVKWGVMKGEEIISTINQLYEEIILWKPNMFLVPSGTAGRAFIDEMTSLLNMFNQKSRLEPIALTAAVISMPLLLQKPSRSSKSKDHTRLLSERLVKWKNGNLRDLLREGKAIQKIMFPSVKSVDHAKKDEENTLKIFSRLMLQGKVSSATKWLANHKNGAGIHDITDDIVNQLASKHPEPQGLCDEALLFGPENKVETVIFESIDGDSIYTAALHSHGSGGPSGSNSDAWKRILCSKYFKSSSLNLCNAVAETARRLCSENINPMYLTAYNASRLIPLKKNPGIRPIGIGEMLRRIIGKAVTLFLKMDITEGAGALQVCAGQRGGSEAAIHAMKDSFEDTDCECIILVDANNAFNCLNRAVALHNVKISCPNISTFLSNTYQRPSTLKIHNSNKKLLSKEGTTQGDNAAMGFYALSTSPLMNLLNEAQCKTVPVNTDCNSTSRSTVTQVWFADDSAAAGKLTDIKDWWDLLASEGPKFGYFPNSTKTWLILKNEDLIEKARTIFGDNINITADGKHHLGAAIGSHQFKSDFIQEKVQDWTEEVISLAAIANSQPQLAYSAFVYGLSNKWTYFLRTIKDISAELKPLDHAISEILLPAICGRYLDETERKIIALPCRLGGLGIPIVSEMSEACYTQSRFVTEPLISLIRSQNMVLSEDTLANLDLKKKELKQRKVNDALSNFNELYPVCSPSMQRNLDLASEKGASCWLTALPLKEEGLTLNKLEFRDALALRYGWKIKDVAPRCQCGETNTIDHSLICLKGGFVHMRHNQVRDMIGRMLEDVCKDVRIEPALLPLTGETLPPSAITAEGARLDVSANGFWQPAQRAFYDIKVIHPNALSYRKTKPENLYRQKENEKKAKYNSRVINIEHGHFTPLIFSTSGGMGKECAIFLKRLALKISEKRNQCYSDTMRVLRTKLRFSVIRSSLIAIRGTRGRQNKNLNSDSLETDYNIIALQVDQAGRF